VTLIFDLQNEWRCRGQQAVTIYQVWLKYLRQFCQYSVNRHTHILTDTQHLKDYYMPDYCWVGMSNEYVLGLTLKGDRTDLVKVTQTCCWF